MLFIVYMTVFFFTPLKTGEVCLEFTSCMENREPCPDPCISREFQSNCRVYGALQGSPVVQRGSILI